MWDYQCLTILRHIFTDLILGTEVVKLTFFKNLQNKNILFLRHHIHDLVPFISWSRGTRHSFGFSRQEAERICPRFPIFRFPDKRHRLYRGLFHTFLIFWLKIQQWCVRTQGFRPRSEVLSVLWFFLGSQALLGLFVSPRSRKLKIWFESFSDIGDFTCDAPAIGSEGYERMWSEDIWFDSL